MIILNTTESWGYTHIIHTLYKHNWVFLIFIFLKTFSNPISGAISFILIVIIISATYCKLLFSSYSETGGPVQGATTWIVTPVRCYGLLLH